GRARRGGVGERCKFVSADFMKFQNDAQFDYVIVMGFMDYMADPAAVVAKVLSLARRRAFFSFPVSGGLLAWQRKLRYSSRCELYMYSREDLAKLFAPYRDFDVRIEPIARDFFVTAARRRQLARAAERRELAQVGVRGRGRRAGVLRQRRFGIGAAPGEPSGLLAGRGRAGDIGVEVVADVQDLARRQAELLDDRLEHLG